MLYSQQCQVVQALLSVVLCRVRLSQDGQMSCGVRKWKSRKKNEGEN